MLSPNPNIWSQLEPKC